MAVEASARPSREVLCLKCRLVLTFGDEDVQWAEYPLHSTANRGITKGYAYVKCPKCSCMVVVRV